MSTVVDHRAAFGVPLDLEAWPDETTATALGAAVGVPEVGTRDNGATVPATVYASGTPTAGSSRSVQVVHPGFPGTAGIVYQDEGETEWQGRDTPLFFSRFAPVAAGAPGSSPPDRTHPHAVALADGTRVVAYIRSGAGSRRVYAASRAAGAASWTTVAVSGELAAASYPCLCVFGDALLCAWWVPQPGIALAQVSMAQSVDGGATWTSYAKNVLPEAVPTDASAGYTLGRLRMATLRGEILLLADITARNVAADPRAIIRQYASSDAGGSFALVSSLTYAGLPDVVVYDGQLVVAYADSNTEYLVTKALGSVWSHLDTAAAGALTMDHDACIIVGTLAITDGECALVATEDSLLLLGRVVTSEAPCQMAALLGPLSTSTRVILGDSPAGAGYGCWWRQADPGTSTVYPFDFCATFWRGDVAVFTNFLTDTGDYDSQLFAILLGGPSTVTMPQISGAFARSLAYLSSPHQHWAAVDTPEVSGWTATVSGTESASLDTSPGSLTVTTSTGAHYYTYTLAGTLREACISGLFTWVSGGSISSREIMVGIRWATTGVGYEAELMIGETGVRLYDRNLPGSVSSVLMDTSAGVYFILAIDEDGACYAAVAPSGEGHERKYQNLANGDALTDDAGAAGTDHIFTFGHRATGTAVSRWSNVALLYEDGYTGSLAAGQVNPDDLWPAPLGGQRAVYLGDGVQASVRGGPFLVGDTVTIPEDATYGPRRLLPRGSAGSAASVRGGSVPSPRAEGRITSTGGRIAFQVPEAAERRFSGGLLAVHLEGCNVGSVTVETYYSSAWHTLGTWDARFTSVDTLRRGARVLVDPAGTYATERYVRAGELAGGYWDGGSGYIRPIVGNTAGIIGVSGKAPRPVIYLDPASITGLEPATTAATLIFPRATLLVPIATTTQARGFALSFSSSSPYEGYIKAGIAAFCELHMVRAPEWGSTRERVADLTAIQTLLTGQRSATVLGPRRKRLELPFTWDAPLWMAERDPQAQNAWLWETGGVVSGGEGMEPDVLSGLLEEYQGGAVPGLYLPYVAGDGGSRTLVGPLAAVYGRLVSQSAPLTLAGGDDYSAIYTPGSYVWEEEP